MNPVSNPGHQQWTRLAVALHWLVAVLILFNIVLGVVAEEMAMSPAKLNVFIWHKSIGLSVLALVGLRLCWRYAHPPPEAPASLTTFERRASSSVHFALYGLIVAVPLTGWWLNSVANFPFRWFGLFEVPAIAAPSETQEEWAEAAHVWLAWGMAAIVAAHIGAALKHHLINRDEVLRRMWPARAGRWSMALLVVALPLLVWWQVSSLADSASIVTGGQASQTDERALSGEAQRWQMLTDSSRLGFIASYDDVPVEGVFRRFDADLRFDPDDLKSSGFDVTIAIASLDTASSDRDEMIRDDTWFFVERFPKARFVTRSIQAIGPQRYQADASLRIRDRQQDVPFVFEWAPQSDGQSRLTAQVVLDRRDFDVGTDSWAQDDTVGFDVTVEVDLLLESRQLAATD